MRIGVVAHRAKSLGRRQRLPDLRAALAAAGHGDAVWHEVGRSKKAVKATRKCLADGVDLLLVWGGDGTVRRCIGEIVASGAGEDVAVGIMPAGTANLLASNLGIPKRLDAALATALAGRRRPIDVGVLNGEHFAVMGGVGFDALMIRDADDRMKARFGRIAYLRSGARHLGSTAVDVKIRIDGDPWFAGTASCVLVANVGDLFGGATVFPEARPDDGLLEVGVTRATSRWQWTRLLGRTLVGKVESSPLVETSRARRVEVTLDRELPYELDGGDRDEVDRVEVHVLPLAVRICVPDT